MLYDLLNARVVCWVRPQVIEQVSIYQGFYREGRILESTKQRVIVLESGSKTQYDVEFRKRQNVRNNVHSIASFEIHARTIPGAKFVNYYFENGQFSHKTRL